MWSFVILVQGRVSPKGLDEDERGSGSSSYNRAREALAEFHRDPSQRPAQDGRLALREGGELARAGRGARTLRRGLQRPGALRTRGARRVAAQRARNVP